MYNKGKNLYKIVNLYKNVDRIKIVRNCEQIFL